MYDQRELKRCQWILSFEGSHEDLPLWPVAQGQDELQKYEAKVYVLDECIDDLCSWISEWKLVLVRRQVKDDGGGQEICSFPELAQRPVRAVA